MEPVQIVEAIIFAAPEPVTAKQVASAMRKIARRTSKQGDETVTEELQQISAKEISKLIEEINEVYNATGRPMHLVEGPAGWRFYTRMDYAPYIRGLIPDVKAERFSGPAMETLAIIAYRQPVTKADIEAVRGVSVDGVLNTIIDRGLVKIGGRADLPGRPLLYETSDTFLEHFGIKNIDDLPNSGELRRVELPSAKHEEDSETEEEEQLSLGVNSDPADEEGGNNDTVAAVADETDSEKPLVTQEEE